MAIDACIKNNFANDSDSDDDEPIVFKRTKSVSKQNQGNPEVRRTPPPPQKNDGTSRNQASDVRTVNGQSSNVHMGKVGSSSKAATTKPIVTYSKQSAQPAKQPTPPPRQPTLPPRQSTPPPKQSTPPPKQSIPPPDQLKQQPRKSLGSNDVGKKGLQKPPVKFESESEDSDDDKPLSVRLSATPTISQKSNSNLSKGHTASGPSTSTFDKSKVSIKKSSEDSEDEIPLSAKFNLKPSGSASVKQSSDSYEEKPSVSKTQQNGIVRKANEAMKSPKPPTKRPLSETDNSVQSSVKKLKPSDASVSSKVKQSSVKLEPKKEEEDDEDDLPIAQRLKKSPTSDVKSQSTKKTPTKVVSVLKKTDKKSKKIVKKSQYVKSTNLPPSSGEGQKWTTLEHNGVIFPPPYTPHGVKMLYNGKPVDLTPEQEEVATMFAVMKDTEYASKPKFIENFMNDWRGVLGKNHVIKKFELCDFTPIYEWHQAEKEKKKQMTTEEKKLMKEEKLKIEEKYMTAIVDGQKEKVGNFRVEPPGLFRGRGEHPKMGKLKKRIRPSDITINIGREAPIPECPIPGERWKEVKHDNTVTWLAFWIDPINQKEFKYVFLAASSSLKGQSDKVKYEKARLLKEYIHNIRVNYTKDFRNKDITKRQIAVATYLIDKLALRAGNEKDDDEADTVGCCTLKVENVKLVPDSNNLEFDFLGKDSIRYFNTVEVEKPVYDAIGLFQSKKQEGDDLFDKLDTSKLNTHLKELMPGLTAKVFRTYNASITLDEMLNKETKGGDVGEKIVVYNKANKEVAIICNHQRTVSKTHSAQMTRLTEKMDELKATLQELETDLMRAKKGKPPLKDAEGKQKKNLSPEAIEKKIASVNVKIEKMERDMRTKEDLKTVALGTSKINYLDPRISVAWCKRHEVPIEKIFNKSLLAKFSWAMDVDPDFRF